MECSGIPGEGPALEPRISFAGFKNVIEMFFSDKGHPSCHFGSNEAKNFGYLLTFLSWHTDAFLDRHLKTNVEHFKASVYFLPDSTP